MKKTKTTHDTGFETKRHERAIPVDCDRVRPLLCRVAEGEANPEEAMLTARHLPDCTACRILLARERRLSTMLEQDMEDDVPVGEDFLRSVMATLPTEPPPTPKKKKPHVLKLACLAGLLATLPMLASSTGPRVVADASWSAPSLSLPAGEGAFEALTRLGGLVGVVANSIAAGLPGLFRPLPGIEVLAVVAPAVLVALLGCTTLLALAARTLVRQERLRS